MSSSSRRRSRPAAIVATLGCLAGVAAATATPAAANQLTVASYVLKAADGTTVAQADCLTDPQAQASTFCQALLGRGTATAQARHGGPAVASRRASRRCSDRPIHGGRRRLHR